MLNKFNKYRNWGWVKISLLVLLFLTAAGQSSTERLKNAYADYIRTKQENHFRFQIINTLNTTDFISGSIFIKKQNNHRANQIIIEILQSYNRYGLIEKIFFSTPEDERYRNTYKGLYYQTLLNNLKTDDLLKTILRKIDTLNVESTTHWKKKSIINEKKVFNSVNLELFYLHELALKSKRQLSDLEKIIYKYDFMGQNRKHKQKIILNYVYMAFEKKEILKKVYQSLMLQDSSNLSHTKNTKESIKAKPQKTNLTNSNHLNSAEKFFDMDSSKEKPSQPNYTTPSISKNGVVFSLIEKTTKTSFLNLLYKRGYYLSYLYLFKNISKQLNPSSQQYKDFVNFHQKKVSQALVYTKQSASKFNFPFITLKNVNPQTQEFFLQKLFYNNSYQKIIDDFKQQQQKFYLLSLAATDQWDILFQTIENQKKLLEEYQLVYSLIKNPDQLLQKLQSYPSETLKGWQLDFLNLVEEDLSPNEVAAVISAFIFKKKDFFSTLKITNSAFLHEYAVANQAQMLLENGKLKEVRDLFRKYYNQMNIPVFKEKLMFLYGVAYLSSNPAEGEKVFFRLLTLNPQSAYRFDIEEALNLLL